MGLKSIIYNEDCVQGMKRYPDKYFDLAIAVSNYFLYICKK